MKRLANSLLPAVFGTLVLFAAAAVQPCCIFFWHQPKVPVALRK